MSVSVGPKVTDLVAMAKSSVSVAVPPLRTSTLNAVEAAGRWLIVTGTSSEPPSTFSFTLAV